MSEAERLKLLESIKAAAEIAEAAINTSSTVAEAVAACDATRAADEALAAYQSAFRK